ncbi:alpha/beta hydrolase [Nonomuraea endophytica]|uniref:Enterochelin esterase family protein n=1 Tax=Nonomuraea endophytica TaxID=714136 RepID=A0A7W8EIG9_9ACTN|nr:alpha/beta hydrolase-fold protein [Nonomuraea endophytica]MBB5080516.1 enterochelin esterase family protein [Nonomuraea endophytica]
MIRFSLPDPAHRLAGVRLWQELGLPSVDFMYGAAGWTLAIPRPPVHRMEYLLELRHRAGGVETILDPSNPLRVRGVFGPKSVLEFPEYSPPGWLAFPASSGGTSVWAPEGVGGDLPLLVVHDGPEYDDLAGLTRYLSAGVAGGWLPPLRAILLHPGDRNADYSANPDYADFLAAQPYRSATVRIGMGTSLGALAMLHAQWRHPDLFDALFLQSGSFFQPRFDAHERRFPYYERVTRFVEEVHKGTAVRAVPTAMTCGGIEENIHNNRAMAASLRTQGYAVTLREVPDVHNYTAWRDAFHPHLTRLLQDVCS